LFGVWGAGIEDVELVVGPVSFVGAFSICSAIGDSIGGSSGGSGEVLGLSFKVPVSGLGIGEAILKEISIVLFLLNGTIDVLMTCSLSPSTDFWNSLFSSPASVLIFL